MLRLIFPICALLASIALLLVGSGLLNTLLALRGTIEGYSDSMLGVIMSGYFFGFFVGTHLALPLINRIGHIRTFAFCAAFTACFSLLHVLFLDPYIWLLLRIMTGASLVILYTVIESWLNGQTSPENRGRVFAIYMMVTLTALALAQQFLHLASPTAFTLFAVTAILICVSVTTITWTRMAQPVFSDAPKMKLKRLWGLAPVALMAAVFSGLSMGAFWGMGALYAGRVGLDNSGIATFISCVIIGGAIFQYPLGRYSDRHDRRRVLAFASALAASAALLMSFFSNMMGLFLAASVLYGGMAFFIYPVAVAHLVDHLDHDDILPGGSTLLLIHGIGAAFGPALAGQLMDSLGPHALPVFFALMQMLLALYTVIKLREVQVEVLENAGQFVAMVRTTPSALEMMPDEPVEAEPNTETDHSR